ncbi:MAG: hypothetical protein QXL52_06285 [Nitrososphaerales archaeon]
MCGPCWCYHHYHWPHPWARGWYRPIYAIPKEEEIEELREHARILEEELVRIKRKIEELEKK